MLLSAIHEQVLEANPKLITVGIRLIARDTVAVGTRARFCNFPDIQKRNDLRELNASKSQRHKAGNRLLRSRDYSTCHDKR